MSSDEDDFDRLYRENYSCYDFNKSKVDSPTTFFNMNKTHELSNVAEKSNVTEDNAKILRESFARKQNLSGSSGYSSIEMPVKEKPEEKKENIKPKEKRGKIKMKYKKTPHKKPLKIFSSSDSESEELPELTIERVKQKSYLVKNIVDNPSNE